MENKRYKIPQLRCKLVREGDPVSLIRDNISGPKDAGEILLDYYANLSLPHERMVILCLNSQNKIVGLVRVAEGGLHGIALMPSDIFRPVLAAGVSRFIIAHNHPSGDPTPSPEDMQTTDRLIQASKTIGVSLMDHIVVGQNNYTAIIGSQ